MAEKYPVSDKSLLTIAKLMFKPLKFGESALVLWFPGTGKTLRTRQILSKRSIVKTALGSFYLRMKLVLIDLDELILANPEQWPAYILAKSNRSTTKNPSLDSVKKWLKLTITRGQEPTFILTGLDLVSPEKREKTLAFFNTLTSFNRGRIHLLTILADRQIFQSIIESDKYKNLSQNTVYIPLPSPEEVRFFTEFFAHQWRLKINPKQLRNLTHFGGIYLLLISALRILRDKKMKVKNLSQEAEISSRGKTIWNALLPSDQKIIKNLVFGSVDYKKTKNQESLAYLTKIGLIKKKKGHYSLTIPYFKDLVLKNPKILTAKITFNRRRGTIKLGDLDLGKILSEKEKNILLLFLGKKGRLCTKDQIAKTTWGKDHYNQYSDWAIDKLISRLREKLTRAGIAPERLRTVRGKGYRWL